MGPTRPTIGLVSYMANNGGALRESSSRIKAFGEIAVQKFGSEHLLGLVCPFGVNHGSHHTSNFRIGHS